MLNFQPGEIVIVLMLALVVLGPERLPGAMRKFGQVMGELRKLSNGFREEFKAIVEEPTREISGTADALRESVDFTRLRDGERDEKPHSGAMPAAPTMSAEELDQKYADVELENLPFGAVDDETPPAVPTDSSSPANTEGTS